MFVSNLPILVAYGITLSPGLWVTEIKSGQCIMEA